MITEEITFTNAVNLFGKKVIAKADDAYRHVIYEVMIALINTSPVMTGNFRTHWRVAVGQPSPYHVPGRHQLWMSQRKLNQPPTGAYNAVNTAVPKIKFGDDVVFSNRTEYSQYLTDNPYSQWVTDVVENEISKLPYYLNKIL